MKIQRKHILSVAGVLSVAALALTGCAGADAESDATRIAYFSFAADNTYSQATLAGIKSLAKEGNFTVESFDGAWDPAVQVAAMEDALASGRFDAFVVSANDGNAVVPVVEDAIAAGVKVVATFTPIGPDLGSLESQVDGMTATIGSPLEGNGRAFATMIAAACADRDPCYAAFLPGLSTLPLDSIRLDAMKDEFKKKHPNVDLVAIVDGGYEAGTGYEATQDLLAAHPEVMVIGAVDQSAAGVELALKDAGLTGKIAITGNGGSELGAAAVLEGRWSATYVNLPFTEGRTAAKLILKALAGDSTYTAQNAEELSPIGAILNKGNAARFKAEWTG